MNELRMLLDQVTAMQGLAPWIIPAIVSALGFMGSRGGGGGDGGDSSPASTEGQQALQQQMLGLIGQQRGYMSQMDPLRESMVRMAMGMLPRRYQTGSDFRVPAIGGGLSGAPPSLPLLPGAGGGGSGTEIQDQDFEDRVQDKYDRFSKYETPEEILAAYQHLIGRRSPPNVPGRSRRE